jgi:DNA-binding NtrC family response regulator
MLNGGSLRLDKRGFFNTMRENLRNSTILVVDDEPLIRWSLRESLTSSGREVVEAGDGSAAMGYFAPGAPGIDLVLLDLKLPDTDGLTVLDGIRRAAPAAKVILMTAYGTPETMDRALALGALRVISKPFNLDDVVGLVDEALRPVS